MLNKIYFGISLAAFLLFAGGNEINAQCSGGTNAGSISPGATFQTIPCVQGGQYYTFPATAGNQYTFTFCSNGGSASFDTQLTILDNSGAAAGGYNDDNCGLQSEVVWTAPSTGTFRILINEYNCTTNATCATLAYQESGPAGPGASCVTPFVIGSLPFNQTGMTTCGFGDDFSSADACGSSYMGGDDFVFTYTASGAEDITITLSNTGTWVGVFVTDDCPSAATANCIGVGTGATGCAASGSGTNTNSAGNPFGTFTLPAAGTYYITVSTFPSPQCTPFDINITSTGTSTTTPAAGCYSISTPAYSPDPYNSGTTVTFPDDEFSNLLPIGFSFCFMDQIYNSFVISSNGFISFETNCAGQYSSYSTTTIPSTTSSTHNSIMAPWADIDPSAGGTIYYNVYGTAPNRRLVVSYDNVSMFGSACTSTPNYTGQITIYETTNIIESYVQNYDFCTGWNSGNGVIGLTDQSGTVAVPVPGFNNTQFNLTNFAVRYTPTCSPCATILAAGYTQFTGSPTENGNLLSWNTGYEWKNDHFIVESSADGNLFQPLGEVQGAGTAPKGNSYSFVDEHPYQGITYYRLRSVDTDGMEATSEVISVSTEAGFWEMGNAWVSETGEVNVEINAPEESQLTLSLTDAMGRVVVEREMKVGHGSNTLKLNSSGVAAGYYTLVAKDLRGFRNSRKLIIR